MPESDKYVYVLSAFHGNDFVDVQIASTLEKALVFARGYAEGSAWEDYAIYKVQLDQPSGAIDELVMELDKNGEPKKRNYGAPQ